MVKVKICGITRWEDAKLAVDLGATSLGFVFWGKSPRFVTPSVVQTIVRRLPSNIATVGVFVDMPLQEIEQIVEHVQLSAVQLYGEQPISSFASLRCRLIKAIGVEGEGCIKEIDSIPNSVTLLLDAHDPVKVGGTGRAIDWAVAATVAKSRQIFLAGGLNSDNVREAVRKVKPYGIDVSSGVERVPGEKDPNALRAFFREALTK